MSTVNVKKREIQVIEYRQERGDEDYGTCLWARFSFDTVSYTLNINSDCGEYSYSWRPTPETESFMQLCSRFDGEYLLGKFSSRSEIDEENTYNEIERYLRGIVFCEFDDQTWEKISAACTESDARVLVDGVMSAIDQTAVEFPNICEFDLYECIVKDYPIAAKKIVQVFMDHIKPKIKELLTEPANAEGKKAPTMKTKRLKIDYFNFMNLILDTVQEEYAGPVTQDNAGHIDMGIELLTAYMKNIAVRAIELKDEVLIGLLLDMNILTEKKKTEEAET